MATYRHYEAGNGRWPSRDPIAEQGGGNLYAFAADPTVRIDEFGLVCLNYINRVIFNPLIQSMERGFNTVSASIDRGMDPIKDRITEGANFV